MKPKVTVLIVTYNHEKYISQALDSVLEQKVNFDYEILVYDDASTDKTVEVIKKKYSGKVKLYARKNNAGLCRNFYDGLLAAEGDYILDLAGDDWIYSNHVLQDCAEHLDQNPEAGGVAGWTEVRDVKKGTSNMIKNENSSFSLEEFLLGNRPYCSHGMLRKCWGAKGKADISCIRDASRNNEEIASWVSFLEFGPKSILQECFYVYRYVNDPNASNYNSHHKAAEIFCDNYDAILYMRKFKPYLNFNGMMLKYAYRYLAEAAEKKDFRTVRKIVSHMWFTDLVKCGLNFPCIYVTHGRLRKALEVKIVRSVRKN